MIFVVKEVIPEEFTMEEVGLDAQLGGGAMAMRQWDATPINIELLVDLDSLGDESLSKLVQTLT